MILQHDEPLDFVIFDGMTEITRLVKDTSSSKQERRQADVVDDKGRGGGGVVKSILKTETSSYQADSAVDDNIYPTQYAASAMAEETVECRKGQSPVNGKLHDVGSLVDSV